MDFYREEKSKNIISKFGKVIGFFALLFTFFNVLPASAASFYFSPASGSFRLGQSFSVTVYASSKDQAANAFQGTVNFPEDKLQVTSISKSGSSLSMWIQEPQFSNGAGTVQYEGVIMNPGYTGGAAKILTINFKVKALGSATLSFNSASILANDGQGTNILEGLGSATYALNAAPTGNETGTTSSGSATAGTPLPPLVKSKTHESPEKWYSNNSPEIYWELPADITGVSYTFTKDSTSDPGTKSVGLLTTKNYSNIQDGEWYFHIRLRNSHGWGATGHRRFKIDTKPPENLKVTFLNTENPENPRPPVAAKADDKGSGIDHYDLVVGDITLTNIKPDDINEQKPYLIPSQEPGTHNMVTRVFDGAGNSAVALSEFIVSAIDPPIISEYPEKLNEGEVLTVKGKSYPNSEIIIYFQLDDGEIISQSGVSDSSGAFSLTLGDKVKRGVYKVWGKVRNVNGAISKPGSKVVVPINAVTYKLLGERTLSFVSYIVQLLGLIALIIILIVYTKRKIDSYRKRVIRDVEGTKEKIDVVLAKLKENELDIIELLENAKRSRQLTSEEEEVLTRLRYESDGVAPVIDKDIDELEEDVKK